MKKNVENMNLEEAIEALEKTAAQMEDPALGMEKSLALYERGMQLSQRCRTLLEGYEKRIQMLDKGEEVPFESEQ